LEHPSIIFKIVCPDRPGLVSLLTSWISNYGGNIKHSDHHTDQDAGLFLSRIEWNSNNEFFNRDEIYKEFEKIADEVNGKFNVNYSDEIPNVAIFVSKQNHCLIDLLWRVRNGELKMKVPLIISNHSDLENIANDFNAKFVYIDTFKTDKSIVEDQFLNLLKEYDIDLVVLVFSSVFLIQLLKIPPIRSSKKLAVLMKFAFMSVELFLLCKSHFLQK